MNRHPKAWLLWFGAVIMIAMITRNPFYALFLLAIVKIVEISNDSNHERLKFSLGRVAVIILTFSILYTAFFIHTGDHVIITLPSWPLVGGPVTLEAIIDGARNGILLISLLAIFTAFNAVLPANELVRLIPAALKDVGIVILVAITYIPETRTQMNRIREAQAIRGHRLNGLRDWRPVVVPLLVSGFERSLRLSETMVARGYGSVGHDNHSKRKKTALLAAVIAAFSGWILLLSEIQYGWLLVIGSAAVVSSSLVRTSGQIKRSSYRQYNWSAGDWLLAAAALVAFAIFFVPIPTIDRSSLSYSPYQGFILPKIDVVFIGAISLLAIAVVVGSSQKIRHSVHD